MELVRDGDNRELLEEEKQILLETGGDDEEEEVGDVSSKKFDLFPHTMADMFDFSAIDSIRLFSPVISHTAPPIIDLLYLGFLIS